MAWFDFFWTDEIEDHLTQHGVSREDFEHVVANPIVVTTSRSSGRPLAMGYTEDGRYIACVYELMDGVTVVPFTAYEVE